MAVIGLTAFSIYVGGACSEGPAGPWWPGPIDERPRSERDRRWQWARVPEGRATARETGSEAGRLVGGYGLGLEGWPSGYADWYYRPCTWAMMPRSAASYRPQPVIIATAQFGYPARTSSRHGSPDQCPCSRDARFGRGTKTAQTARGDLRVASLDPDETYTYPFARVARCRW